jgi:hypothetical protein
MHAKRLAGTLGSEPEPGKLVDPRDEIVAYLRAHPDATDSLDGIVDWWLARQRYETASEAIQAALDDLASQGILEVVTLGSGLRLYRLATPPGPRQ